MDSVAYSPNRALLRKIMRTTIVFQYRPLNHRTSLTLGFAFLLGSSEKMSLACTSLQEPAGNRCIDRRWSPPQRT